MSVRPSLSKSPARTLVSGLIHQSAHLALSKRNGFAAVPLLQSCAAHRELRSPPTRRTTELRPSLSKSPARTLVSGLIHQSAHLALSKRNGFAAVALPRASPTPTPAGLS